MIRYDGKIALVTGGGRGIGRAHALTLAARGASVVVNDLGTATDGTGSDDGPAQEVVREIEAAGGTAIASVHDCGTPEGGQAVVDDALERFGQVDIFVHNAGIVRSEPFADAPINEVRRLIDIHLLTAWYVGQPVWRGMSERNYGRIVFTSSASIFGFPKAAAYVAAKAGLIGLAKSLNYEAQIEERDIKINAITPIGASRIARKAQMARWGDLLEPEAVSAAVAYLVSEECSVSGEVFNVGGSHVGRIFLGETAGWSLGRTGITPEDVAARIDDAMDTDGYTIPSKAEDSTQLLYEQATGRTDVLHTDNT